jgi:hypothetical protein
MLLEHCVKVQVRHVDIYPAQVLSSETYGDGKKDKYDS